MSGRGEGRADRTEPVRGESGGKRGEERRWKSSGNRIGDS